MSEVWKDIVVVSPSTTRYLNLLTPKNPLVIAQLCSELSGSLLGFTRDGKKAWDSYPISVAAYADTVRAQIDTVIASCFSLPIFVHPTYHALDQGIQLWAMSHEATPDQWQVWTGYKYCYGLLAECRFASFRSEAYRQTSKRVLPRTIK